MMNGAPASRTQFPLIDAFALTVHKVQGLTLPDISLNLDTQMFEKGQSYVAISRCNNWKNVKFKQYFRITKTTFEWLCTEIAPLLLQRNNQRGVPRISIKHKVSLTLWFLATGQSYRTLGQLFALGESTICYIIRSDLYTIKCHFLSSKIR